MYRDALSLLDDDTNELIPMVTQENIGKKFTYNGTNVMKKKTPWRPPGPVLPPSHSGSGMMSSPIGYNQRTTSSVSSISGL